MLKPYDNQADIPEEFKEHYSRREDGKWHADISNDHPTVKHNATLLKEKNDAIAARDEASGQLASAQASGLPRGHVAVPKADADLLEKVRAHGTAEEITAKLDEHKTLKQEFAVRKLKDTKRTVAEVEGLVPEALIELHGLPDNPDDYVIKDTGAKDDKGNPIKKAYLKLTADGVTTEKAVTEFLESSESHRPFLNSLKPTAQGGTKVLGSAPGSASTVKTSIVDEFIKERDAKDASKPSPFNRKTAQAA